MDMDDFRFSRVEGERKVEKFFGARWVEWRNKMKKKNFLRLSRSTGRGFLRL